MTISTAPSACTVRLKRPHTRQLAFINSTKTRRIIRAGRRSGKTTGLAIFAVQEFLKGERVLYTAPVNDQVLRFWHEVTIALAEPIDAGLYAKNETLHIIERLRTEQRIRAKSAWSADTLRGDFCTRLIMDEWQLCAEEAWHLVGAPMMLDREGSTAIFCYTPPSLRTLGVSKAEDPMHAAKMFAAAKADTTGRWDTFHFTSHENPHLSRTALDEITQDMSALAHRREILAEDQLEVPGALWTAALLDRTRVTPAEVPALTRVGVALDPAVTSGASSDEMGIVAGGRGIDGHGYTLRDASMRGTPAACARVAIQLYDELEADIIVGEANNGGEWIGTVIALVAAEMQRQGERSSATVHYKMVHASRGKQTRAEPVAALFEHGRAHHVGHWPELEAQMTSWVPGMKSPDRMDACLIAGTLITTANGDIPIEQVTTEDQVWTRAGWQRVLASGMTSRSAPVRTVAFSDGSHLTGTDNHPVYVLDKGFCTLDSLVCHDIIMPCKDVKQLNLTALFIRDFQTLRTESIACTSLLHGEVEKAVTTATYGHRFMGQFLQVALSIIQTTIPSITLSTIWSVLRGLSMRKNIQKWEECLQSIWRLFAPWRLLGISQRQAVLGIVSTGSRYGMDVNLYRIPVMPVAPPIRPLLLHANALTFVVDGVRDLLQMLRIATSKKCFALSVEYSSGNGQLRPAPQPAPVTVVNFSPGNSVAPVYNLTVEHQPEYFANGILVHNCAWLYTELILQRGMAIQTRRFTA